MYLNAAVAVRVAATDTTAVVVAVTKISVSGTGICLSVKGISIFIIPGCSGFVSFVWGINPGPYGGAYTKVQSNNHITSYAKEITKDKLRFGEAIYIYNKHIILFDKWANKEHTRYYAYQMCNRGNCRGLTHKIIPFPFSEFRKPNENHYKLLQHILASIHL